MNLRSRCAALALAAAAGACAGAGQPATTPDPGSSAAVSQQPTGGAFVVTIGRDTLAVERYTRTADRLAGTVVARSPRTVTRTYAAELRPDGSIARLEMTTTPAAAGQPPVVSVTELTGDSAITRLQRGDSAWTSRVAASGRVIPFVGSSYAMFEQAMMQARAAGLDSAAFVLVPPGNAQTFPLTVAFRGDSARINYIAGLQRVATDARGTLLGLDGIESTQKFLVTRVPDIDVLAMQTEFARRDAAGQGVGPLSPRDSAVAEIGGARLAIDYGRPAKRGRTIMGEVVPWGQVWRTGANAATGFRTTRDLEIGGVAVPAGAYTLWTIPGPDGWQLIVNQQTGQWGTEYDAARDLARIDMQVRRTESPVEQFIIRLEPTGGESGVLRLAWDDTEAFVPFRVR